MQSQRICLQQVFDTDYPYVHGENGIMSLTEPEIISTNLSKSGT